MLVLTFCAIKRDVSVGEQIVYNYAVTFFSVAALVAYDAPVHNWLVMGINLAAPFMEGFYTVIFFFHAEGRTRQITS